MLPERRPFLRVFLAGTTRRGIKQQSHTERSPVAAGVSLGPDRAEADSSVHVEEDRIKATGFISTTTLAYELLKLKFHMSICNMWRMAARTKSL